MSHFFKHLRLITKHRNRVIKNAFHMGIFWHALKHDLSKYGPQELFPSAKYYVGDHSPVYEQRLRNHYFSSICQHHTRRNPHHWEYWTDFFMGRILIKSMPWLYATEYVCDMLSASYCYNPKKFSPRSTLEYFQKREDHYFMSSLTKAYVEWCLSEYAEHGWKNLGKKNTKAKYLALSKEFPEVEVFETSKASLILPELKK